MNQPIWTPLHLRIMLHYCVSPELFRNQQIDAACEYTKSLVGQGLLEPEKDQQFGAHFKATEKGKAFVEMLCNTPLPEQIWINPRFKTLDA